METDSETAPAGVQCRHCGELHPTSFTHCPKSGASLTAGRALVGRVVANRYRVLALLDEGGMGAVYVAEHLLIGRKVALKRLHPELTGDDKAVARFQREARAAAATGHEHIVEILDLGFGDDGAPFLVMEYLRGRSLARLLEEEERLEPMRACRIVGQVLAALEAVHHRGIVHRDLKPDNILLTRRQGDPDFVKVVDFGISKVQPEEGEKTLDLTRTGVMLGTPFYMSPEQARGIKDLDHRVDLFGCGVILYECLAGTLPFDGDNYHQLLQTILSGEHPPLDKLRHGLEPELVALVHRAIASSPDDRFQSAREMHSALVPHGALEPGPEPSRPPPPGQRIPRQPFPSSDTSWRAVTSTTPRERDAGAERTSARAPRSVHSGAAGRSARASAPRGLAPQPNGPSGPPRRFVAQSSDWRAAIHGDPGAPHAASVGFGSDGSRFGAASKDSAGNDSPGRDASEATPRAFARTLPGRFAPARATMKPAAPRFEAEPTSGLVRREAEGQEFSPASAERAASVRESASLTYGAVTHTPGVLTHAAHASPAARDTAHTEVKGALILSALEQLRQRGPDALRRVLSRMDEAAAARVASVMMPMEWLPLGDLVALVKAAERELGGADGPLAVRLGRACAESELSTTHRLFLQTATPTIAMERIPKLFRSYHSGGRASIERATSGGYRITAADLEPDLLTHALAMSGFYQRLIELTGGRDVRASVVSCRERGDDATCTIVRWK